MSLYGAYIKERLGDGIVERLEGFATYRFINKTQIYIMDIYVHPDFRNSHIASELADEIIEIGKKEGAKELLGTVVPSTNGSTHSLRVLLGYGFSLSSATNDLIIFKKEI